MIFVFSENIGYLPWSAHMTMS